MSEVYGGVPTYSGSSYSGGAIGFDLLNLFLAVLAIVGVIVVFFLFNTHRTNAERHGLAYNVQEGVTTGTTDTMDISINTMYIVNSSSPITLTVALGTGYTPVVGRVFAIKNNTTNNTTLQGEPGGVTLDAGQLNLTVTPGQTAQFMATNTTGTYLRLQ